MNFVNQGYHLAITHGNGPQVGNALLRVEMASDIAPRLPLGICDADTEGGMGYMIEQSLQNSLIKANVDRDVVTLITQIIVDINDPSIKNPSKYIGGWYTEEEIIPLSEKFGWQIKEVPGKGWRRVVPSPFPRRIINRKAIKHLVDNGTIVIAAGGGGIPVYVMENGLYEGFDAVIDKDLASSVLAGDIGAQELIILTDVDQIAINFGKTNQQFIDEIHKKDLQELLNEGQFPPGSMGPKVRAAINFLENGGESVTITSLKTAQIGLDKGKHTRILP